MAENKKHNFTSEQKAAILHRGSSLLVSAAAGSGKTRVLVERLLNRIEQYDDIDEFLVITYTRAAAAELRDRIYNEIIKRREQNVNLFGNQEVSGSDLDIRSRHMWRQSMLCRTAQINTIHSFCIDVLRENAHLVGLQPDFRVVEEVENSIIKTAVLDDVLNNAYEVSEASEDFFNLVNSISPSGDDKMLAKVILSVHAKLQSCPDLNEWVTQQIDFLNYEVDDVGKTVWGDYLLQRTEKTAEYWHNEMMALLDEMKSHPDFMAKYGSSINQSIINIGEFISGLRKGWDAAKSCCPIDFPKPGRISGFEDLKNVRKRCMSAMKKCTSIFECSSEELIDDMKAIKPELLELFKLLLNFDKAYANEKVRRGVVDFSDLEHLCLSLLVDLTTGEKTTLAKTISKRYKEILIDEYQDVNIVQEMIFNAISQNGNNIFMVGDVKQSIYRFRLANPAIFLEKYDKFKEADISAWSNGKVSLSDINKAKDGEKIHLSKNFRSRSGILKAVNAVFKNVMSEDFGEMNYTEKEFLVAGRTDDADNENDSECAVEIDVIDLNTFNIQADSDSEPSSDSEFDSESDDDNITEIQAEARFIAERIMELTNGKHFITDKSKTKRVVKYSDIVILLRSIQNKAWQYASALTELGIPSDLPGGEGYFESVEVSAALSILMVIDNPMQDIPLAAVLRGPIYGFSADELAEIRAKSPNTDFYNALIAASASSAKCAGFLQDIEALRRLAPDMPADRFIWHVFNKTGLLARVGTMRHGERRRDNLILLAENARILEQSGYKGLFGFLNYIKVQKERELDPIREVPTAKNNAVRIMTIHKSKGLEFPVVFLANSTKKINNTDINETLVFHNKFGIGCKRTDLKRRIKYSTLSRMAIQSKLSLENLSEELRVLYVAMTRAEEKLIIVATYNDAQKEIDILEGLAKKGITPQLLEEKNIMAAWVLLSALMDINGYFKVNIHESYVPESTAQSDYESNLLTDEGKEAHDEAFKALALNAYVEKLKSQFSFEYPYKNSPNLPSKLTVTELKNNRANDGFGIDSAVSDSDAAQSNIVRQKYVFERPEFIKEKTGMTSSELGTAMHLVMQYIDFTSCGSLQEIDIEIERLETVGFISAEQASCINRQKIFNFFESDIGKRLLRVNDVRREFKFTILNQVKDIYPELLPMSMPLSGQQAECDYGNDKILIQGVIDCFFEEDDGLVLLDFKTDYVTMDTIDDKVIHYKPQLVEYASALERITGKKIKERLIYFFSLDKLCEV